MIIQSFFYIHLKTHLEGIYETLCCQNTPLHLSRLTLSSSFGTQKCLIFLCSHAMTPYCCCHIGMRVKTDEMLLFLLRL